MTSQAQQEKKGIQFHWFAAFLVGMTVVSQCNAFAPMPTRRPMNEASPLRYSVDDDSGESVDMDVLRQRVQDLRIRIIEEELQRPPNPDLSPQELVEAVLSGLLNPYDPTPDAGFRLLLRASTPDWRARICRSIGAPTNVALREDVLASVLGDAIGRPNNQFAILVGEAEEYITTFPSDVLDYQDGTCWLECRLRAKHNNELLVITGWELRQRQDGAWLVDTIDWQDFRDEYTPGIGREAWVHVCG